MKYCRQCGAEVLEAAVVCTKCGCAIDKEEFTRTTAEDKVHGGLMALSILIPLIGVILWPVKHKETPKAAMSYGIAGIISWAVCFIILGSL